MVDFHEEFQFSIKYKGEWVNVNHDGPKKDDWDFMVNLPEEGDVNVIKQWNEKKKEFEWVEEEYLWTHEREVTELSKELGKQIDEYVDQLGNG